RGLSRSCGCDRGRGQCRVRNLLRGDRDDLRSPLVRDRRSVRSRDYRRGNVRTGRRLRRAERAPEWPQRILKTSVCAGSSCCVFLSSVSPTDGRCRTFGKRCSCLELAEKSVGFKRGNAKRCRDDGKRKKGISHAAAQRRDEDGFRCAVASLREKSS